MEIKVKKTTGKNYISLEVARLNAIKITDFSIFGLALLPILLVTFYCFHQLIYYETRDIIILVLLPTGSLATLIFTIPLLENNLFLFYEKKFMTRSSLPRVVARQKDVDIYIDSIECFTVSKAREMSQEGYPFFTNYYVTIQSKKNGASNQVYSTTSQEHANSLSKKLNKILSHLSNEPLHLI